LKWRILIHISGILTYLFYSSALQRKGENMYTNTRQMTSGGSYINTTTSAISSRHERTSALHQSPQNNAFAAIAVIIIINRHKCCTALYTAMRPIVHYSV